jgi:hypothetical protein
MDLAQYKKLVSNIISTKFMSKTLAIAYEFKYMMKKIYGEKNLKNNILSCFFLLISKQIRQDAIICHTQKLVQICHQDIAQFENVTIFSSLTYSQSWLLIPLMDANCGYIKKVTKFNNFLKKRLLVIRLNFNNTQAQIRAIVLC